MLLPLGVLEWPALTLLLGISAGIAVFAGEQAEGAGRFLAEQRLPPNRVFGVKVGVHLVLAVSVALLLLIPTASRLAILAMGRGPVLAGTAFSDFERLAPLLQLGPYLTLWLGYGFSVGCLCGLLVRKRVVAGMLAAGLSLLLVTLWAPSLLVGGLHAWQVWGPPVLLLLMARWLLWPWATGRLNSGGAVLPLTGGLLLAWLWFAGAVGYRVVEVPLVGDELDLAGFEQMVEAERKNETGQLVRQALLEVAQFTRPRGKEPDTAPFLQLQEVVSRGWPAENARLGAWVDDAFRRPWAEKLAEAARMPPGIVEDLQSVTLWTPLQASDRAADAAALLAARGLQLQARGDPAAFLDHLATGLALVRQVRHRAPSAALPPAWSAQTFLLEGVERWLERLGKRPDLLRRALDLLVTHEQAIAKEGDDHLRANYLVAMNTVNHPESWAGLYLAQRGKEEEPLAALVSLAWRTPWEQARLQRLVRLLANRPGTPLPLPEPLAEYTRLFRYSTWYERVERDSLTRLRAHELMLALRLFQAEMGHSAETLQELTPRILPSLPVDPATGEPFFYRVALWDDRLEQPGEAPREVKEGQGILKSKSQTFLVPLPPR
jgi:hypothetical protein